MTSIYFYEDDYCQIEILPVENLGFCLEQAGLINEFAQAHKNGIGYTDVFMCSDNPIKLQDNKIPCEVFEKAIIITLPKYDEVYSEYSSFRERCESISAFGCNESVVAFYEDENGFVKNIWLTLDIRTANDIRLGSELFVALSTLGDFLIADWGWCFIEKVNEYEKIKQYLQNRFDVFTAK